MYPLYTSESYLKTLPGSFPPDLKITYLVTHKPTDGRADERETDTRTNFFSQEGKAESGALLQSLMFHSVSSERKNRRSLLDP